MTTRVDDEHAAQACQTQACTYKGHRYQKHGKIDIFNTAIPWPRNNRNTLRESDPPKRPCKGILMAFKRPLKPF